MKSAAEAQSEYYAIRLAQGSLDESAPNQLEAVDLPSGTVEAHAGGRTPTTIAHPNEASLAFWLGMATRAAERVSTALPGSSRIADLEALATASDRCLRLAKAMR